MRVGILELLTLPAQGWAESIYDRFITKTFPSITPQAIAVWCRERGHRTDYATYYGIGDPRRLLPRDLDVVFLSSYTQTSPLAYALAKLYRRSGIRTVFGGPHAKAYPADCARFFDVVVRECDRALVDDILRDRIPPGSVVSSARPFAEVPSVEERLPEIRRSTFLAGRPAWNSLVPMLASLGCPYRCDFCVDWNNPYRLLPTDRLAADLVWIARHLPGTLVGYHDPNFAVRFDEIAAVIERLPPTARNPYVTECSLSVLRPKRLARLRETGCGLVAAGIESWSECSDKAGVGRATGAAKLDRVVDHFREIHEHIPYVQANFIFGLDTDQGDEPVALLKEFMERTPFVWPVVNVPHPFGATPLHDRLLAQGRILEAMPFLFYYSPYVVTTPAHYDPVTYYERLAEIFAHFTSGRMLRRRLATARNTMVRAAHVTRTLVKRRRRRELERLARRLREDRELRAFHEGRSASLPAFYRREYDRRLGRYADLLDDSERTPVLD